MTANGLALDIATHGYLASNQLSAVVHKLTPDVVATVVTTMSSEKRQFSWIWEEAGKRALLANRVTGTLFDPESGVAINASPMLAEAPIPVPQLTITGDLPNGQFAT